MSFLLEGVLELKAVFAWQTWIVSFGVGLVGSNGNYGETKTAQPLPPSANCEVIICCPEARVAGSP